MLALVKDTVPVTAEKKPVGRAEGGNAVCPRGAFPGLEAGALESQSGPPSVCFCLLAARSPAKVGLPQSLRSWAFLYSGLLGFFSKGISWCSLPDSGARISIVFQER